MPKIVDEISAKSTNDHVRVAEDWARAQKMCPPEMELKFTLPGPITIFDTMKNEFYENKKTFATHMVKFVNEAVLSLVNQGCKYIQVTKAICLHPKERRRNVEQEMADRSILAMKMRYWSK